jgi:hypothetical protein
MYDSWQNKPPFSIEEMLVQAEGVKQTFADILKSFRNTFNKGVNLVKVSKRIQKKNSILNLYI